MSLRRLSGLTAALTMSGVAAAQFSLFLPSGAATGEGPSSTPYPWNRNNNAIRVQQVYDSTHFTYALSLSNLEPARPASLVLGTAASLGGLLPLDLSVLGPGCALTVFPEISFPFGTAAGSLSVPIGLPVDPMLNGLHGYVQAIVLGTAGATSRTLDVHMQIH